MASRKNNQRGTDEIHVTMGHAPQAMITPMIVSFP
jgi:hypothetical protein